MAIEADTGAAIRHPDLGRLVQAVVDADEHDEADWIEWKSTLDLTKKTGCFAVARTVLGLANRMPDAALLACAGLGYVVVGAEPGSVEGIISVDPADLDQMLEPWLGGPEGPRYTTQYVVHASQKVLVVTVEAPKYGDPVYMLRKDFEKYRDGDVFVRKVGRTHRANSSDMNALHRRMHAAPVATPDLEVSLVGDVPLSWFDRTSAPDAVASWVQKRRSQMESDARAHKRRSSGESSPKTRDFDAMSGALGVLADTQQRQQEMMRTLAGSAYALAGQGESDTRTLSQFLEELETWAAKATEEGIAALASRYLDAHHGRVALQVHNPSGRYLPNVRVEAHFAWELLDHAETDYDKFDFPPPPRRFGKSKPSPLLALRTPDLSYTIPRMPRTALPRRSWVEDGSVKIVFNVGDLRQEGTDRSDALYLMLPARPDGGILRGTWKATVPDVYGVIAGALDVPVKEEPTDLRALLDNVADTNADADE